MSRKYYGQYHLRRTAGGLLFGGCIRKIRETKGRSVEEAARLAGMEASEWLDVEAGRAPGVAQLRPIAHALELSDDNLTPLLLLCRDAWEM